MTFVSGSTSTYSKAAYLDLSDYPKVFISGTGCEVQAHTGDGKAYVYIDFTASLGAIILGYDRVAWRENTLLPGPHISEEKAAEALCTATGWDQVRWCKNGSDATEAAVRLARYVTDRDLIITNSYHGSHSDLIRATLGKEGGVRGDPEDLYAASSPQQLLKAIRLGSAACVIMEPVTPTCTDWHLQEIHAACKATKTLLIFDEILTGFRCRYGSIAPQVIPDLACYGKAIGNGASIACVAGPRELMRHFTTDVFMSGTNATEIHALTRCADTLKELRTAPYGQTEREEELRETLGDLVQGYTGRWQIQLPHDNHHQFVNVLARHGVLVGRDFFMMFAHQQLSQIKWDGAMLAILHAREECGL